MVLAWRPRVWGLIAGGGAAVVLLTSCSLPGTTVVGGGSRPQAVTQPSAPAQPPTLTIKPADSSQAIPLDTPVTVAAENGKIQAVTVQEGNTTSTTAGQVNGDGTVWELTDGLDSGATYTVTAVVTLSLIHI